MTLKVNVDGRRLAVECWGDPDAFPVFLLHGTPGSRSGPHPRSATLFRLGVKLISYDRPGYGGSDRDAGRTIADAARDIERIADTLGLDRFSVVGRSGGGPHALACAALLRERVTRVAALVSLAPPDADGLNWYDGMGASNSGAYNRVDTDEESMVDDLRQRAKEIQHDPERLLRSLLPELTGTDHRVVDDVVLRRMITHAYAEALTQSPDGWIDDVLAFRRPWGFQLGAITVPTLLWHGARDTFSPVGHTLWLADRIRTARVEIAHNAAHFGAVEVLPQILAWLVEPGDGAGTPRSAGAVAFH